MSTILDEDDPIFYETFGKVQPKYRRRTDPIGAWYNIDLSYDDDKPYQLTYWYGTLMGDLMEMNTYSEDFATIEEAKEFGDKFVLDESMEWK